MLTRTISIPRVAILLSAITLGGCLTDGCKSYPDARTSTAYGGEGQPCGGRWNVGPVDPSRCDEGMTRTACVSNGGGLRCERAGGRGEQCIPSFFGNEPSCRDPQDACGTDRICRPRPAPPPVTPAPPVAAALQCGSGPITNVFTVFARPLGASVCDVGVPRRVTVSYDHAPTLEEARACAALNGVSGELFAYPGVSAAAPAQALCVTVDSMAMFPTTILSNQHTQDLALACERSRRPGSMLIGGGCR